VGEDGPYFPVRAWWERRFVAEQEEGLAVSGVPQAAPQRLAAGRRDVDDGVPEASVRSERARRSTSSGMAAISKVDHSSGHDATLPPRPVGCWRETDIAFGAVAGALGHTFSLNEMRLDCAAGIARPGSRLRNLPAARGHRPSASTCRSPVPSLCQQHTRANAAVAGLREPGREENG